MQFFKFFILALSFYGLSAFAQNNSQLDSLIIQTRTQLYSAYDQLDEQKMLQCRATFERLLSVSENKWICYYYIALSEGYLYRHFLLKDNEDKAEEFNENALQNIEKSIELNKEFADSYALWSKLLGEKMSISPLQSIFLGPKSGKAIGTSLRLDPDNPRAYLVAGISSYFTPAMFGGSVDNAKNELKTAIKKFENYEILNPAYPDWGHEESYVWLGIIASTEDSLFLAKEYFQKALEIKPDYPWVKYNLLPELEKKIGDSTKESDVNK